MLKAQGRAKERVSGADVNPLVSVIVPTFNRAPSLVRALRSVLQQTYTKLEIIVVDDASTDRTDQAVKECEDARIRHFRHETSRGGAAARNTGIRAARGEYIAFLDDDDEWEPTKVALQLAALTSADVGVVLCMSTTSADNDVRALAAKQTCDLEQLRAGMPRIGAGASAIMARTDILKNTLFDEDLPRCQDWDLLIRLAVRHRIHYLPEKLVRYNDGMHVRISNAMAKSKVPEERWLRFFDKHRAFFGERWYRRHVVNASLYGFSGREKKVRYLRTVSRRVGLMPLCGALIRRLHSKALSFRRGYLGHAQQ